MCYLSPHPLFLTRKTTTPLLCRPSENPTVLLMPQLFTQPPIITISFPLFLCSYSPFIYAKPSQGGPFCRPRSVTPSSTTGPREFPSVFLFATSRGMAPSRRNPVVLRKNPVRFDFPKTTFFGVGAYLPCPGRVCSTYWSPWKCLLYGRPLKRYRP